MSPALLASILFASASSALPQCGLTDGHFRVYQIEVKDLEAAKGGLSKSFAFARSYRTSIACEALEPGENPGPADQRHAETRWIPKQGRAKFESELASLGKLRISENKGAEPAPPPPAELAHLRKRTASERDPVKRRVLAESLASMENWEDSYRSTRNKDLVQVRLLWREKDQPPYSPPAPRSFNVAPKTVLLPRPVLAGEELRLAVERFKRNED